MKTDERISALWAGVIHQAINDLDGRYPALKKEAFNWMYKERRTSTGSFEWICDMIDLDADKLRLIASTRSGRKKLKLKNMGLNISESPKCA